ncbi:MAG: isoprenylcysteine carboxylmethyltransferase family protein [bacterium]|nr:isoprenylcysteine carboxylmethyltransferase family protein [bacterium]
MRSGVGALVAIAGALLAVRSALLLAGRGRPRRGPQPTFVIAGAYRRVRNPLFAGLIVAGAGVALWTGSTSAALFVVATAIAAHLWVVRVEEPRLLRRFGEAYRAYRDAVPRWLPRR